MAGRIRDFDWASTPLGPIARWPQSLKTIVDLMLGSPCMMSLVWGLEAIHLYNDSFTELLREHRVLALGRSAFETFARSRDIFEADIAAGMAGRSVRLPAQRYPVLRRGQLEDAWFDVDYAPIRDETGAVAGVLWTLKETTAQHLAEEALRTSEERHRLLIESWAQAEWETDAEGAVRTDSPSWRAYTGQTLEEWLGYGWLDAIHPEDRAYAEQQWREAIAVRGRVNAEFRLRAPDGGWRWTNVLAAPVLDAGGSLKKWAGLNIDIHARRRIEAALRESEELRRIAVTGARMGTWRWDLRDKLIWGDAAFLNLWGFPPSNEPRRLADFTDRMTPQGQAEMAEMVTRAIAASEAFDGQLAVVNGPTTGRWVQWRGQAEVERPWIVNGVSFDVTDQHLADQRLHESKERQAFLLTLSDAVRPLAGPADIQGETTRLLREQLGAGWCYYVDWDTERKIGLVLRDSTSEGLPSLAGAHDVSDAPEFLRLLADGTVRTVRDYAGYEQLPARIRQNFVGLGFRSMMMAPLVKEGSLIASLLVGDTKIRDWSPSDALLLVEVAERTWAAIERGRAEAALRDSEERFSQFAASSSDALWIRDAATLAMEYTSPAIQTIYGIAPDAILGDMQRWVELIVPNDRDTALAHIEQARAGASVTHEFRIRRPADGGVSWIRNTDFPLRDAEGRVQRIGGIAQDITEAKRSGFRLEVLVNELQHRARNLLGVVTAIADRTVKQGGSVEAFEERLQALGRAQGLLSQGRSDTVEVGALVRAELAAHADGASGRVTIAGPEVSLRARQVQNFALALHELATNAAKYGALKIETGRLEVIWEVVHDRRERPRLALSWNESGVTVEPVQNTRRGYGTELITEALAYALQAEIDYTLGSDGVRCRIEMPV